MRSLRPDKEGAAGGSLRVGQGTLHPGVSVAGVPRAGVPGSGVPGSGVPGSGVPGVGVEVIASSAVKCVKIIRKEKIDRKEEKYPKKGAKFFLFRTGKSHRET